MDFVDLNSKITGGYVITSRAGWQAIALCEPTWGCN